MFLSQRDLRPPATEVTSFTSKTQPQPQESDVEYLWIVAFHWDLEKRNPFSIEPIGNFSDSEVPQSWYRFRLRDDLRKTKINVEMLKGQFSVFAKVERGIIIFLFYALTDRVPTLFNFFCEIAVSGIFCGQIALSGTFQGQNFAISRNFFFFRSVQ